jgi:SAM-dependent methyltransferase
MNLTKALANRLRLPGAPTTVDQMNSSDRLKNHRQILEQKPGFRQLAFDIQKGIIEEIEIRSNGTDGLPIIEIGAGVIPLSSINSQVISTDIEISDGLSCVASATEMPFLAGSARAVVGQNVFHHIPNHDLAMDEFARVLVPNGIVLLIEPYFGRFASLVYPALFASEGFDKKLISGEKLTNSDGVELPNQAVSFSYFSGGALGEIKSCPKLEIISAEPMKSGLRYLCSGALNFRQVVPNWFLKLLRNLENRRHLGRVLNLFAIHWVIVMRVTSEASE